MKKKILIIIILLFSITLFACKEKTCNHAFTEQTCTSPSFCKFCGEVQAEALDHNYSLIEYTASTCTTNGFYIYECTRCRQTMKVLLQYLPHTYIDLDGHKECSKCGKVVDQYECEHSFSPLSCIAPSTCGLCGLYNAAPLDHIYTLVEHQDRTSTEPGYDKFECTRCKEILQVDDFSVSSSIKNLIIFIGDGMGYEQVSGAMLVNDTTYTFTTWNTVSVNTDSLSSTGIPIATTDSGAGGTAIATGVLTKNSYVGMDPSGTELKTILDYAKEMGMKTGIVTTDVIHGATPADFSAHNISRSNTEEIIHSELLSGVDLIIGNMSGTSTNAVNKYKTNHQFYRHFEDICDVDNLDTPLVGVIYLGTLYPTYETLAEVVLEACRLLDNENGFVLMVEEAEIDHPCHNADFEGMVNGVQSLSDAVDAVLNEYGDETAIIVTADHETGGLSVSGTQALSNQFEGVSYSFTTTAHSNTDICLYYYNFSYNFSSLGYYKKDDLIKNSDTFIICKDIITTINLNK